MRFAVSLPSTMFQICGDMEAVGFPVQNAHKIAYGDVNTTFESRCKRKTFEPLNCDDLFTLCCPLYKDREISF